LLEDDNIAAVPLEVEAMQEARERTSDLEVG
jgi:hypothetical protein